MTGGQNFGPSWAIQALSLGHFVVFPLYCGFWSSRILLTFSTFCQSVGSSVRHRCDFSTFLDNLMVWTMKTIYYLNAYHVSFFFSAAIPSS